MWQTFAFACSLLALIGRADAASLDDWHEQQTIDEAISAASEEERSRSATAQDPDIVKVELDILYTREEYALLYNDADTLTSSKRKAMIASGLRWVNATVPFRIEVGFSESEMTNFMKALEDYHAYTCLSLRPFTPRDLDYLGIQDGDGCSSYVGRRGGRQAVTLARGCRSKGIIIHELGHAIGFLHEQTRPDRDEHVSIAAANIQDGKEHNFRMRTYAEATSMGVAYDYLSVMHYGERAFSKNSEATIIAKDPRYQKLMGNRKGFTFKDIKLANLMYNCAAKSNCPNISCPEDGFVGKDCQCWCDSNDLENPVTFC